MTAPAQFVLPGHENRQAWLNNGDRAGEHPKGCSGKPRELRRVRKVLTMTRSDRYKYTVQVVTDLEERLYRT